MNKIKGNLTMRLILLALTAFSFRTYAQSAHEKLQIVARLEIRPGDVAVSKKGRIFSTIHSLGSHHLQLIEILGTNTYKPYPDNSFQKNGRAATDKALDSPLGLIFDEKDNLWVIDMGQELGKTRLWYFDIKNNKVADVYELPASVAPKGSFIQDVAIDIQNSWAYLADINNPGIIALDLKTRQAHRFGDSPALQAEDIDMVIDGKLTYFGGKPARIAVDPITLSHDKETLYFGAMSGKTWYSIPTRLFREGADNQVIAAGIRVVGKKPISDGAATDKHGNHYFTNLTEHAITRLGTDGNLTHLIQDERLRWPDNVYLANNGWYYVSVNELNTTPAFTGGKDAGKAPYFIYRFKPSK